MYFSPNAYLENKIMLVVILFLIFCTACLVGYAVAPGFMRRLLILGQGRQQKLAQNMEQFMPRHEAQKMNRIFFICPIVLAGGFFFLFPEDWRWMGVGIGLLGGLFLPIVFIGLMRGRIQDRFHDQLVDALMIMSSSFRGGLSLIQAMEAVVDEMPEPINKEFGMVLAENKMGVSLEEALNHLYNRMPSSALQQMTTAILLARETGGNLPVIFKRIVTNIRENKKIQQNLNTLTIQGKIQGVVMSLLPIAFAYVVYTNNRGIFEHMFQSDLGRFMLTYCLFSWIIGVFLIWKISQFKDF